MYAYETVIESAGVLLAVFHVEGIHVKKSGILLSENSKEELQNTLKDCAGDKTSVALLEIMKRKEISAAILVPTERITFLLNGQHPAVLDGDFGWQELRHIVEIEFQKSQVAA